MDSASTILIFSLFMCGACSARKIPSYVTICHRSDPELNKCMLKAFQDVLGHIHDGIPELYIPSLNPLIIPEATLDNGPSFKARFRNIELYEADKIEIREVNFDVEKNHFDAKFKFPELKMNGEFDMDGKILILTLKGKGIGTGNFTNVDVELTADGEHFQKNGKEHIKFDKQELNLNFGKAAVYFDGLFGDNKELNDQTNKVLNENIEGVIGELKTVLNQAVTKFAFDLVNRILSKFSIDELFPQ